MQPLVSVIMANYNTNLTYLKEAIDSILNQTFSNFELIIIDDGSTDNSYDYIKNLKDSRIIIIRNEKNCGQPISRNKAINISKGKYIAIMDSDDISLPNRLQIEVDYMENNPDLIACGSWFEKFGSESNVRKPILDNFEYYRCQLLFYNTPITMCHPSSMLRKSMLDEYNIRYNVNLPKAQDYGLWVDCAKVAKIGIVQEVLLNYRVHASQISTAGSNGQAQCADMVSNWQLEKLGVDTSNERIHDWRRYTVTDKTDFFNAYNWLVCVREANEKSKIYNVIELKKFTEFIIEKYLKCIRKDSVSVFLKGNSEVKAIIIKLAFKSLIKKIK